MVLWIVFQFILLAAVLFVGVYYFEFFYNGFAMKNLFISLFFSISLTLFTFLFFLTCLHKLARMLMKNEEGILTGRDRVLWGITMTSADTAYYLVNKLFINQIFPALFYKLFGAKFGKRVAIFTRLWDVDLMEIGDDTSVGTNCIIGAHAISQGELFRKRIKIGKNCTIGAGTIILPGVTIEDNVIVASNSVIPSNRVLKANSIYAGSPVKRIKDWNGESVWES
ncbi:MAG: acyltransferase [Candidatus Hermodarchaeota archaeon]